MERSSGMNAAARLGSWWRRESSPRSGPTGWWGSVVYERCSQRIQLSRPRRIGCCIVPGGIIHAHTTRVAVGGVPLRNCTLRRMESEVVRGAEVPKPYVVVETEHGASEGFLLSRVGRGHDLMVACSVAKKCGISRHDELVGVGEHGTFVYKVQDVSL